MKPLKDMGHKCNLLMTKMSLHIPDFVPKVKEISHKIFMEHETQENVPGTAYTDEERRELARQLLREALELPWMPIFVPEDKSRYDEKIEEFIKEQGL